MKNDKRTVFSGIIEFFSPTSSFVLTIIGAVLSTLLAVKFSGQAGVKLFAIILAIWVIFSATFFVIKYVQIQPLNEQIESLNEKIKYDKDTIEKQSRQLENQMNAIAGKYGEFGIYIRKNKNKDLMKKLVNNFPYLECVQIHNWNMRVEDNNLIFKLTHDNSYVKEGVNINNINQQYYKIDKEIYKQFKRAIDYYKNYKDSLDNELIERITSDFTRILNNIPSNYSPEYDRIISIIIEILKSILPEEDFESIFNNSSSYIDNENNNISNDNTENEISHESGQDSVDEEEETDRVMEYKRTGILGAILMNSDYMYEYEKNDGSKLYRRYFSFLDRLDNENKIITFIINSNSGENVTYQRLLTEVVSHYECLYENLK